jgi:peroxiredoxin Q/BCP
LSAGDRAPSFKIASDGGRNTFLVQPQGCALRDLFLSQGRYLRCTKQAIGFSESLKKFEKLGVTVIGISKDSLESHAKFRKKHKLKIALGSDPETKMANDWGVWARSRFMAASIWAWSAPLSGQCQGRDRTGLAQGQSPGHVEAGLAAAAAL